MEMPSEHVSWRIRGVPRFFDKRSLADALRHHLVLQSPNSTNAGDGSDSVDDVFLDTLAPDLQCLEQVATVRFPTLPPQLQALEDRAELTIEIPPNTEDSPVGGHRRSPNHTSRLTIDMHFHGTTVLYSPTDHDVDVLAVCGLGGHAMGSFIHKRDRHMWLRDSLPQRIPKARVMIYGYDSGLQHSTNLAQLGDLAKSLRTAITRILRSGKRRLVLIGHSLGGLLIKEALTQLAESDSRSLVNFVSGVLFFGVPNHGMDIESLIPMVNDQANRPLLDSLHRVNSWVLMLQDRDFSRILDQRKDLKVFCFYETEKSPTAAKVSWTHCWRSLLLVTHSGSPNGKVQNDRPSSVPRGHVLRYKLLAPRGQARIFPADPANTFRSCQVHVP